MTPSIIKTQMRLAQKAAKAKTSEEAAAIEVQKATLNSEVPVTPSQQIMSKIIMEQQRQEQMKKFDVKNIAKILQNKYIVPADILTAQREQASLQELAIQQEIKAKQREQEYAMIAPKETVQNSEQEMYVDQKRLELLEKIYNSLPPKKKANFQQLVSLSQFNQALQDYQGGFVDPNYDKQMRPLGKDTTKITEF